MSASVSLCHFLVADTTRRAIAEATAADMNENDDIIVLLSFVWGKWERSLICSDTVEAEQFGVVLFHSAGKVRTWA